MTFAGTSSVRFPRPATEENPPQGRTSNGILLFERNKSFHQYDSAHFSRTMGQIACEESIDMCHGEALVYVSICREAYLCARLYNRYDDKEKRLVEESCLKI